MKTFDFKIDSDEGATFEPWTDGWSVGFKVTAEGLPDRYVYLCPSSGNSGGDIFHTDVFAYHDATGDGDNPLTYINIWDEDETDDDNPDDH